MFRSILVLLLVCFAPCTCYALVEEDLSQVIEVVPGGEYPMKIRLHNSETKPVVVSLKQADYSYVATGESYFEPPGTIERSNAGWIEVQTSRVEIPPGGSTDVHYVVRVPKKLSHQGSYWSLILIEPDSSQEVQAAGGNATIQVKIRYAYQVVTNIGKGNPKLELLHSSLAANQDRTTLYLDVINNGEVFLKPRLNLKIYDTLGKLVKNVEGMEQKLLPATSVRFPVEIEGLSPASYTGLLLLRDGDSYFAKRFSFEIPEL